MKICVKKLSPDAKLPTKAHDAVGWDLYTVESFELYPQRHKAFSTGLVVYPTWRGQFIQVVSRSGLAVKHGLTVLCGIIDPDYRGELKVVLANTSTEPVLIKYGDKIAQFLVLPKLDTEILEVDEIDATERGSKGFGSSG